MTDNKKNKVLKTLEWINDNCDSVCFIMIFIISVLPWFIAEKSSGFYAGLGGVSSFVGLGYLLWYSNDSHKPRPLICSILSITAMSLGILSMLVITSLKPTNNPEPIINFLYTYFGALMGMMAGGAVIGAVASKKE